jgi:fatty acid-binding protein DegV
MFISDKKKKLELSKLVKENSQENALQTELEEHISETELHVKLKQLENSM